MIHHFCHHGRGPGPKNSVLAATERFVGPDQIVAGHTDRELGLQPTRIDTTPSTADLACRKDFVGVVSILCSRSPALFGHDL